LLAREISLDLPHLRLAARAWGDPALPPLLALHGWLDNAASFDELALLLCPHFHIVALDLPGHGRSQHRPPGAWYHFVDYLGDVLAAADALHWPRFHLLGHSLGAGIASALAAACPSRVDKLLLIELIGPHTLPDEQALTQLQRALTQRSELSAKPLRVFAQPEAAIRARLKAGGISYRAAQTLVTRGLQSVQDGWSWSSDPRLMPAVPQRYGETQIVPILRGIRAPTLLIMAEPMALPIAEETILARARQVAGLQLERLPGNHHLHLEDAAPVAGAILRFMQRADATASPQADSQL
jgi:pimeloyl-ACP methyl ester carboxylesterase